MPDPDLTSSICDGETSTAQVGVDETSLDPNKRLVVVKRDNRTIVNDDAIPAGTNNGDLPGGLKLNICGEKAEVPYAARQQDANSGNELRIQRDVNGDDCGLVVMAPVIERLTTTARVSLAENPVTNPNPVPVDGPDIQTITITNTDSVDRLFSIRGRFSIIVEVEDPNVVMEGQYIARSALEAVGGGPTGTIGFIGGGALNSRVVTLTYPAGPFGGYTMNEQFEFCDEVVLPAGVSRQIRYYTSTIRSANVVSTGTAVAPFRGVNLAGISKRSEQVGTVGF